MNTLLIIGAVLCAVVGVLGSLLPALPGLPVSWAALLLLHLSPAADYTATYLIVYAVVAGLITLIDYIIPVLGTKKLGGTKAGTRGSTWGLVVSIFVLPLLGISIGPMGLVGLLAGPFVGAYLGEKWSGNGANAMRSAWGSFLGFLAGTMMKLAYSIVVLVVIVVDIIR